MSKRTLKDWFYLEMVSHRTIDNIMQTPKKEVHFFFFSVCCIIYNCSWQLIIFDKKQKRSVKRIHLVNDDGLYDRKAFHTVKMVFYSSSMNDGEFINYEESFISSFLCRKTVPQHSFFFYLSFYSQTFTIHGTVGERGGYFFKSSLPLSPASQTLRHYPGNYCRELTPAHS